MLPLLYDLLLHLRNYILLLVFIDTPSIFKLLVVYPSAGIIYTDVFFGYVILSLLDIAPLPVLFVVIE